MYQNVSRLGELKLSEQADLDRSQLSEGTERDESVRFPQVRDATQDFWIHVCGFTRGIVKKSPKWHSVAHAKVTASTFTVASQRPGLVFTQDICNGGRACSK